MVVFAQSAMPASEPVPLSVPGMVEFDRWRVHLDVAASPPLSLGAGIQVGDADVIGSAVVVRPAAAGEPIGIGTGTKTIGDALAEAGVPHRLRHRWPVLEAEGRPAMIVGVRTAAWAWQRPGTTRYLVARISVIGPEGT